MSGVVLAHLFSKLSAVLGVAIGLPLLVKQERKPAFASCVFHVVAVRAKKQMIGIDAQAVIARMAHTESLCNWPFVLLVSGNVGHDHFAAYTGSPISAI